MVSLVVTKCVATPTVVGHAVFGCDLYIEGASTLGSL